MYFPQAMLPTVSSRVPSLIAKVGLKSMVEGVEEMDPELMG